MPFPISPLPPSSLVYERRHRESNPSLAWYCVVSLTLRRRPYHGWYHTMVGLIVPICTDNLGCGHFWGNLSNLVRDLFPYPSLQNDTFPVVKFPLNRMPVVSDKSNTAIVLNEYIWVNSKMYWLTQSHKKLCHHFGCQSMYDKMAFQLSQGHQGLH